MTCRVRHVVGTLVTSIGAEAHAYTTPLLCMDSGGSGHDDDGGTHAGYVATHPFGRYVTSDCQAILVVHHFLRNQEHDSIFVP